MRLTVIIPVLDVIDTLPAQLDSLSAQDVSGEWEVVIADNGSTDGTLEFAREMAAASQRFRVVTGATKRSVGAARNLGITASAADAVAFCDGDDVVSSGWVQAVLDGLERFPALTGPLEYSELNPTWLAGVRGRVGVGELPYFDALFPFMNGANLAVRRDVLDAIGLFDERRGAEDIEFAFRLFRAGHDIGFVPEMTVQYRLRPSLRATWNQSWFYGAGRRGVRRCVRSHGYPTAPPKWRNAVWLGRNLLLLTRRSGRYRWAWVLGSLAGETVGRIPLDSCDVGPDGRIRGMQR